MSKKKIIAVILFVFMGLFMFAFANPNEDNLDTVEDMIINVDPNRVIILEGEDYNTLTGVTTNSNKQIIPSIDSTISLIVDEYDITYRLEGETQKLNERKLIVVSLNGDMDNDGFTNKEEKDAGTNLEDPDSHPETTDPSIHLIGPNPYAVNVNSAYVEPGFYIVLDPHDTITTRDNVIVSNIDLTGLGNKTKTYTITDRYGKTATATRNISVIDTEKPIIKLIGEKTIQLERGSEYVDLGASVTDNYDKNLKATVDSSQLIINDLGTYTIRYNVTDTSGNVAEEVTRTVEVVRNNWDKTLSRIEVTLSKTEYKREESIEGLTVTAIDNDGTSYEVTSSSTHDFNSSTVGDKTLTVTYKGKNGTVDYKVVRNDYDKTLNRIEATLSKTEYQREELIEGLTVTAIDNDGTSYEVTSSSIHDFNSSTVGNKTLTVTYEGKETTIDYLVVRSDNDKLLNRIEATLSKNTYNLNESIFGLTVTAIDNDETSYDVTMLSVNDFNSATGGNKTLMIYYGGKSTSLSYVVNKELVSIRLELLPNVQLSFQRNSVVNIKDYIKVIKLYNDNSTEVAAANEYEINNFSTSKSVGTYNMTAILSSIISNELAYKITSTLSYPTKFEIIYNESYRYNTKWRECFFVCWDETGTKTTNYKFLEVIEHYDENIDLVEINANYTNGISEKLKDTNSFVNYSRYSNDSYYDPVYIIRRNNDKDIMDSQYIINTLEIIYKRKNYGTYKITFDYNEESKTFTAIAEEKISNSW